MTFTPLANDTDANQPGMVPSIVSSPQHGNVAINPDGSFTYTPNANYNGPDNFSYHIGPVNGATEGIDISNTATVHINVAADNDTPVVPQNTAATTAEDTPLTLNLLTNVIDADGDTVSLSLDTNAATPQHGSVQIQPNGQLTYTPDANYFGADSFSYTVSDGSLSKIHHPHWPII